MITLHYLNNSRAQRILWLLEELELDYEIKTYQRDPVTMFAPDSLLAVHPLGKSPIITDDSTQQTLAESGAIAEYLVETYAPQALKPEKTKPEYWQYVYWMHYAEGSLMPPLLMSLVFNKMKTSKMPFFIKPIAKMLANNVLATFISPNLKKHLAYIDAHLGKHTWFAGDQFTVADIQMSFPLEASLARGTASNYRNIAEFVERFQQREAYQKALKAGMAYDYSPSPSKSLS